jgi:hypothetical protein
MELGFKQYKRCVQDLTTGKHSIDEDAATFLDRQTFLFMDKLATKLAKLSPKKETTPYNMVKAQQAIASAANHHRELGTCIKLLGEKYLGFLGHASPPSQRSTLTARAQTTVSVASVFKALKRVMKNEALLIHEDALVYITGCVEGFIKYIMIPSLVDRSEPIADYHITLRHIMEKVNPKALL